MRRRRRRKSIVDQVKESVEVVPQKKKRSKKLISTGSTLLNLACADRFSEGLVLGTMINLIGDSSSGKSILALSIFAEMAQRSKYKDYRLIYDEPEAACHFNLKKLFGAKATRRIEMKIRSDAIEDFQANVFDAIDKGKQFIYILDSLDSLTSDEEIKKAKETIKARKDNRKIAGTYGMAKPKKVGEILRQIVRRIEKTKSLLIIVSQTRDNINPLSFAQKTRAGGRALKFYCTHEIWLAIAGKRKRNKRAIGIDCKAKITKNKLTGKVREVQFPIFYDYGVDDITSCIEFLIEEKHWSKKASSIQAEELGVKGTSLSLPKRIEDQGLENDLRGIVEKIWNEIEDGLKLNRKRKYA